MTPEYHNGSPLARRVLGSLTLGLAAMGCWARVQPEGVDGIWTERELAILRTLTPLAPPPPSHGNRFADDPAAAELGQALFFETRLGTGNVSCATCHVPGLYFTDGKALAKGTGTGERHTPSVIGSQYGAFFLWDGRTDSLWSQALQPFENPVEMNSSRLEVVHLVRAHHAEAYEQAFGPLPDLGDHYRFPATGRPVPGFPDDPLNVAWSSMHRDDREVVNEVFANVGKAIEAYERLLLPEPAPFDRFVAALEGGSWNGDGHLSPAAWRGLEAFIGPAGCVNCHNGPMLTDHGFHNVGLPHHGTEGLDAAGRARLAEVLDRGRAEGAWKAVADPFRSDGPYGDADRNPELEFLAPNFEDFEGAFKTPSLRNVAMTAPFGHAGQFEDLEEVVEWYRDLPRVPMVGHRDLVLGEFDDAVDTADLVAFLESLTGPLPDKHLLGPPR